MAAKLAVFMAVRAVLAGEVALAARLATSEISFLTTCITNALGHKVSMACTAFDYVDRRRREPSSISKRLMFD